PRIYASFWSRLSARSPSPITEPASTKGMSGAASSLIPQPASHHNPHIMLTSIIQQGNASFMTRYILASKNLTIHMNLPDANTLTCCIIDCNPIAGALVAVVHLVLLPAARNAGPHP